MLSLTLALLLGLYCVVCMYIASTNRTAYIFILLGLKPNSYTTKLSSWKCQFV